MQRLGRQELSTGSHRRFLIPPPAFLGAVFLALLLGSTAAAQDATSARPSAGAPADALDRGTPRGTVRGFLIAAGEQDFETASEYLDLRELPGPVSAQGGPELARQLNFVLSRTVDLEDYEIDDTPDGAQGDGLPSYRDHLARIPTADGAVDLYLQHVPRNDGEMIWKVSNQSIALIPALYSEFAHVPWVEAVRKHLPDNVSFLGLELYKWVIGVGLGLLAWPLLYLLGRFLTWAFVRPERPIYPFARQLLTGPLVALGVVLVVWLTVRALGLGAVAQKYAEAKTVMTIVLVWFLWSVIGLYRRHKQLKLEEQGRMGAARVMKPLANFLRLLVLLAGILFWLSNIGVNISTVLAGLGIGGLALALALQKPIEDLMGAFTLFTQAPVRVGDLAKYGEHFGEIEDIGLRTTRLRTLDNTLVCVPNALIAHSEIENVSARGSIRFRPTLRLRYDTTPDQLQGVMKAIRKLLEDHPRVLEDRLRVRFTQFGDDAILVGINSYVDSQEFSEFLEIAEDLNLRIMQAVHEQGVAFALPGRVIYGTGGNERRGGS